MQKSTLFESEIDKQASIDPLKFFPFCSGFEKSCKSISTEYYT